jgi:protein TonB
MRHLQKVLVSTTVFAVVMAFALAVISSASANAQDTQDKAAPVVAGKANAGKANVVPIQIVSSASPTTVINDELTLGSEPAQYTYVPAKVDMVSLKKNLEYPAKAIAARLEGKITLVVYLNAQGEPVNVNFEINAQPNSNVANELAQAAFKAVKNCKFTPATRNNEPVSSAVKVPVRFIL